MAEISVIMPIYNAGKFLRETLDYVVNQSYKDIEIICVDDGSTDDSPAILAEYAARDSRVTVLTQKNQYSGAARNNGLSVAHGKYVIFLDADDVYEPDMLACMHQQIVKTDADICLCVCAVLDINKRTGERSSRYLQLNCDLIPRRAVFRAYELKEDAFRFAFGGPTDKLIRRDLLEKYHLRFAPYRSAQDFACIFSSIALADKLTVTADKILTYYRRYLGDGAHHQSVKTPTNVLRAHQDLKDKLTEEHVFDKYQLGFNNELADQFSNLARNCAADPSAFASLYDWYMQYDSRFFSKYLGDLSASVLGNALMTFEGVDPQRMNVEEIRNLVLQNDVKYEKIRNTRGKQYIQFLIAHLSKATNPIYGTVHSIYLLARVFMKKKLNRQKPAIPANL